MSNYSSDDLNARVIRSVRECWERRNVPALLSWLGNQGGAALSRATKDHGLTVRQYLSVHLSDQVRVIQHSTRKQLVGAIPIAVDVNSEGGEDSLLERTRRQQTEISPRFRPAFWAAFRKPIEHSKHRYVTDMEPIEFRDVSSNDERFGVEIGREYIVGPDADPSQVQQLIQDWFEDKGVSPEIYLSTGQERRAESHNLLDRVLGSLEPSELKRVTIPLDVVLKLRRQLL